VADTDRRVQNALKDPNVLLGVGGALLAVAVSPLPPLPPLSVGHTRRRSLQAVRRDSHAEH
jgi:hypothetical protein